MKRFEFRLERVLAYRRAQAGLEQAKLLALETELSRRRALLDDLNESFAYEVRTVKPDPPSRVELGRYRMIAENERIRMGATIAEKTAAVDRQRECYVKVNQTAEVLEKLKSKQKKVWESELQKELDSLAMDSYLSRWKH